MGSIFWMRGEARRWSLCGLMMYLGVFVSDAVMALTAVGTTALTGGEITLPSSGELTEAELTAELFRDPTNLDLNFALLTVQLDNQNYPAAAATLDRLLLLDPDSKLTKILLAEVRYKLGEFVAAETLLTELFDDVSTPADMRRQAKEILALLRSQRQPSPLRFTISAGYGVAGNARAASGNRMILLSDFPITNTTSDKAERFYDYEITASYDYELPYQVPRFLTFGFGAARRDYMRYDAADTTTYNGDIAYRSSAPLGVQTGASYVRRDDRKYKASINTTLSWRKDLERGGVWSNAVSARRNYHFDYPGVADHKHQNGYSLTGSSLITLPVRDLLLGAVASISQTRAERLYYAKKGRQIRLSASTSIAEWQAGLGASRSWTNYDAADLAVSARKRRDVATSISASLTSPAYEFDQGASLRAVASGSITDTKSNIPNFARKVNEARVSVTMNY